MATKIGMSSNALVMLGDSPISTFDNAGAGAQALSNLYESTYLDLVTSSNWSFARKQLQLSQNTTPPVFDNFEFSYAVPPDMLMAQGLRSNLEYRIYENKLLYTNDSKAEFTYFSRPDEGELPPYFVLLVEVSLAAVAAMAVTDNTALASEFRIRATSQYLQAIGIDAQNDTNQAIQSNPFIEVRN